MLDHKIYTFITLCELMNYRATAEALSMTQPAVTQHIQSLEQHYNCKLFTYKNKTLTKTKTAIILQEICQSAVYNETVFLQHITSPARIKIRFGATKTIGDYAIEEQIIQLISQQDIDLSVIVDNTENLLRMLDHALIDFALVEGDFNKQKYAYFSLKKEEFVGICAKTHPFAHQVIPFDQLFDSTLILREKGSGTRDILEQLLLQNGYSIDSFSRICDISSFELIKKAIVRSNAITFAFRTIADSDDKLATFQIFDTDIYREFNYVYLKESLSRNLIDEFLKRTNSCRTNPQD